MENFQLKFAKENLRKVYVKKLNDWEIDFISTIEDLLERGIELTRKQFNTLKLLAEK
jgi:hypothetical protein